VNDPVYARQLDAILTLQKDRNRPDRTHGRSQQAPNTSLAGTGMTRRALQTVRRYEFIRMKAPIDGRSNPILPYEVSRLSNHRGQSKTHDELYYLRTRLDPYESSRLSRFLPTFTHLKALLMRKPNEIEEDRCSSSSNPLT
jgi:hypothetical protein